MQIIYRTNEKIALVLFCRFSVLEAKLSQQNPTGCGRLTRPERASERAGTFSRWSVCPVCHPFMTREYHRSGWGMMFGIRQNEFGVIHWKERKATGGSHRLADRADKRTDEAIRRARQHNVSRQFSLEIRRSYVTSREKHW
jgi:hypothetical protein